MYQSNSKSSIKSLIIGGTIIGLLIAIAIVIFNQQFNYNPAVIALSANSTLLESITLNSSKSITLNSSKSIELKPSESIELKPIVRLVNPFKPLSASETFDVITLSDKIDGKAELYLPAGFKLLTCQRFKAATSSVASPSDNAESNFVNLASSDKASSPSDLWIELFIYDMTLPENAFAVFSRQRRENSTPVSIAQYAYQTENALFLVHGHFYLEMIASVPSADAVKWMTDLGQSFINDRPDLAPKKIDVPDLFPIQGLDKDSITLITADAFGFDRFDNVYTASYVLNGIPVTAFISKSESIQAAVTLAGEYAGFLANFGGNKIDSGMEGVEGVNGVEIMDTIEFVFASGRYLAGVRETENLETAKTLVNQLRARITATGT